MSSEPVKQDMDTDTSSNSKGAAGQTAHRTTWLIDLIILIGSTLTMMATSPIAPALPRIAQAFSDIPNAEFLAKVMLTLPALTAALSAPFYGGLLDRFGRKRMLIITLFAYSIFGVSGYFFDNIYLIIFSRALFGITIAGTLTTFMTLVGDYYKGAKLAKMMGLQTAFMSFGGVFYIAGGGVLADISWHAPFLLYLAGLVYIPAAVIFLWEPLVRTADRPGFQKARPKPIQVDLKPFFALYLLTFIWMTINFILPVQVPFLLKSFSDSSAAQIGLALAGSQLVSAVTAMNFKRIRQFLRTESIYSLLFLLMAIGFLLLVFAQNFASVVLALLFTGFGVGLFIPNVTIQLIGMTQLENRGRLLSGITVALFLGQFASPVLYALLIEKFSLTTLLRIMVGVLLVFALGFYTARYRTRVTAGQS